MAVFHLQFPEDFELRPSGMIDAFHKDGGSNFRGLDFIKLGPTEKGGRVEFKFFGLSNAKFTSKITVYHFFSVHANIEANLSVSRDAGFRCSIKTDPIRVCNSDYMTIHARGNENKGPEMDL